MTVDSLVKASDFLCSFKAVIFDLDDTLYSEKDYVRSGYAEISRRFAKIDNMADKLWCAFENGKKAINFVLEKEGMLTDENLSFCLDIYRRHQPNISLYPQAGELLKRLSGKGIRLGLITDGRPEGQRAKLNALGITPYFEKIIITDELGGAELRKPNPKAFEEMQSYFKLTYEQMVYVGDNPKKDFTAPKSLGMDFVYFINPDGMYSQNG